MRKILSILIISLCSCTRAVYVPVQHTMLRTDTLLRHVTQRDSIHVTDSVRVFIHGDTVEIERLRDRWRERTVTDTLRETKELRDTIPVLVEVERPLTAWQRTKQDWGGWAILAALIGAVATIFMMPRKR